MRLIIIALSVLLLNAAFADEPSPPTKMSIEDALRLDNAQTHIREIVLTAQININVQNEVIQKICTTYKIEPCANLEQLVDLKTGAIHRPEKPKTVANPAPPPKPPVLPVKK